MTKKDWKNLSVEKRIDWLVSCALSKKEALEIYTDNPDELPDEIKSYID